MVLLLGLWLRNISISVRGRFRTEGHTGLLLFPSSAFECITEQERRGVGLCLVHFFPFWAGLWRHPWQALLEQVAEELLDILGPRR